MPSQASMLYRLQTTDLDLARHRTRLKEIDNLLNNDATIAQATEQLAAAEKALKPWQTRARDLELETKSLVEKIHSTDADLYSGRVSSPKALQELQSEIESLKRHQSQLEDNQLEVMLEVEDLQGQSTAAQQKLADARAALASQQIDLLDEQKRLQAEVAKIQPQRDHSASSIDPAAVATYEKLRQRYRGQAVAILHGEGCSMCGVDQTSMRV
ncbi:MAG: hypothetical protein ABI700_20770, partial [Chloroflexota bacterium]